MSASATLNLGFLGNGGCTSVVLNVQNSSQKPLILLNGTQSLPFWASSTNHLPKLSYSNFNSRSITNVKTAVAAVDSSTSSGPSEKVCLLCYLALRFLLFLII